MIEFHPFKFFTQHELILVWFAATAILVEIGTFKGIEIVETKSAKGRIKSRIE